jgi:ABC-type Mn2+/Zn2+ transport system permease subunit
VLASLVAGVACPLVGCFLLVRRTAFQGIVLPQFAAAGVALGYALLPLWIRVGGGGGMTLDAALSDPHLVLNFLLVCAALATGSGLAALSFFGARPETESSRVAGAFALAMAATLLFSSLSPIGGELVDALVRGEVLGVDVHDFETLLVGQGLAVAALLLLRRDLLLASYDPDTSAILGRPRARLSLALAAITGLVVAIGALIVGPLLLFGLLVLPPLAAHGLSGSFDRFLGLSAVLGLAGVALAWWLSLAADLPLGVCVCITCSAELALATLVVRARR